MRGSPPSCPASLPFYLMILLRGSLLQAMSFSVRDSGLRSIRKSLGEGFSR